MWNITKSFLAPEDNGVLIKVDPTWGFSEFPQPGDTKKHLLPILVDHEEVNQLLNNSDNENQKGKVVDTQLKEFWMPDRFCKVCYGCEEAFTMYRRRHHCRMCGQIFCNNCSSFYIDGMLFNIPGLVRACRLCYDQLFERNDTENKLARRKLLEKMSVVDISPQDNLSNHAAIRNGGVTQSVSAQNANRMQEQHSDMHKTNTALQNRASDHFLCILERMVAASSIANNRELWKDMIGSLVREVVSSVDPDVRGGDGMDIRQYVKIKIIPGGSMDESVFIDGVVFRKNVSHKKMARTGAKTNPRMLLLAGGIEFQRTDTKLSSMDTLIEQEDKYMEILVEKIMSLRPDIILVGKAVARKAQELLCEHNVIVMQNVKPQLLERLGRMTGAMLLPSTDHMIKQFGEECLGSCGQFWLRVVHDDPEKLSLASSQAAPRILRTRISRGSTYAYVTGCPSERGCTIVLRGDHREALSEVKRILEFGMVVAYHLRLEVMYYQDRGADLPSPFSSSSSGGGEDSLTVDYGSDVDDQAPDLKEESEEGKASSSPRDKMASKRIYGDLRVRQERYYLSTSLDVDISLPYSRELVGTQLFHHQNKPHNVTTSSADLHQTLLITSLLMSDGSSVPVQKASAEVKGIKYYTKQDIALGQFIVDNCFQLSRYVNRGESRMLDQTLSFIHRPGRIDISVHRHEGASNSERAPEDGLHSQRDPLRLPIFMSSYCKECRRTVTPLTMMSEETWKMSFGKFLEMFFYNRTAQCRVGGCSHPIRDCHTLSFQCEGYVAIFDFIPLHAYALHVRECMEFPTDFHNHHTSVMLRALPTKHTVLMEDFKMAVVVLERESREMLANRPEDLQLVMADIALMDAEMQAFGTTFMEELLATYLRLPRKYQDAEVESFLLAQLDDRVANTSGQRQSKRLTAPLHTIEEAEIAEEGEGEDRESVVAAQVDLSSRSAEGDTSAKLVEAVVVSGSEGDEGALRLSDPAASSSQQNLAEYNESRASIATAVGRMASVRMMPGLLPQMPASDYDGEVALSFPMYHMRDTFVKASGWNTRIDAIYRFLEVVRHMLIHQQQAQSQNPGAIGDVYSYEEEYLAARIPLLNNHASHQYNPNMGATTSHVAHTELSLSTTVAVSGSDDHFPPPPATFNNSISGSFSEPHPHSFAPPLPLLQSVSSDPTVSKASSVVQLKGPPDSSKSSADKMSRITKVISRFLGNKDNASDDHGKFLVPLGDFGEGRYGLRPGLRGDVIPVHEDEFATIIAYSLASAEYAESLAVSLKEDFVDNPDYSDANFNNDAAESSTRSAGHSSGKNFSDDRQTGAPLSPSTLSRKESNRKSQAPLSRQQSRLQQQRQEEEEEDNDIDLNDDLGEDGADSNSSMKDQGSGGNSGMNSPPLSGGGGGGGDAGSSEVERAFANAAVKDSEVITSGNLFNNSSSKRVSTLNLHNPAASEQEDDDDDEALATETSSDQQAEAVGSPHSEGPQKGSATGAFSPQNSKSANEKQMISQNKSYIRHRFNDLDDEGNVTCKFQCQIYWAKQFEAVRTCYFADKVAGDHMAHENFIRSLSMSSRWVTQGGKSGAAFSKSMDDRLVVKVISRVELQMFLEFAPAYFEYMAKAYYHSLPTVLCKILGVYTVRFHNKESGKKVVENVVVMENIFYQRNITRTFDLKGSSRARYVDLAGPKGDDFDEALLKRHQARRNKATGGAGEPLVKQQPVSQVLLDDNLMELTRGRPFPLKHRAKLFFHKAVLNDTLFLSIVNVVDYSILVGFDENSHEIVVGIIDYMRQYDIIKKMERMGKSVGMLTGQAEPTIIQPSQYRKRFSLAMERYFMTVPDKWVSHDA